MSDKHFLLPFQIVPKMLTLLQCCCCNDLLDVHHFLPLRLVLLPLEPGDLAAFEVPLAGAGAAAVDGAVPLLACSALRCSCAQMASV